MPDHGDGKSLDDRAGFIAQKLRDDPSYKKFTAYRLQSYITRPRFREILRPAGQLQSARRPYHIPMELRRWQFRDLTPSLELGMRKAERRPARSWTCCSALACEDRSNFYEARGWEPIQCHSQQERRARRLQAARNARIRAKHAALDRECGRIMDTESLWDCSACGGKTALFHTDCCECDPSVGEQALKHVMVLWICRAHHETRADMKRRALLGEVLEEFAKVAGLEDRFDVFFLGQEVSPQTKRGLRAVLECEYYRDGIDTEVPEEERAYILLWPDGISHLTWSETPSAFASGETSNSYEGSGNLESIMRDEERNRMMRTDVNVFGKRIRETADETRAREEWAVQRRYVFASEEDKSVERLTQACEQLFGSTRSKSHPGKQDRERPSKRQRSAFEAETFV